MAEKEIYITLKIERLIDRIEISVPHDSGSTDSSEHRQISDSFLEKIEETICKSVQRSLTNALEDLREEMIDHLSSSDKRPSGQQ